MTGSPEPPTVGDKRVATAARVRNDDHLRRSGLDRAAVFRHFPDEFRYVLGLQESVVIGTADGFAQATGNAALVNPHSAAGLGHALGNLFTLPELRAAYRHGRAAGAIDGWVGEDVAILAPQTRTCRFPASGSSCKSFVPGGIAVYDPGPWQWVAGQERVGSQSTRGVYS